MRLLPFLAFGLVMLLAVAGGVALAPYLGPILVWLVVITGFLGVLVGIFWVIESPSKWPHRPPSPPLRPWPRDERKSRGHRSET